MSPERRRIAVQHARDKGLSERHACQLVSQPRGTQRYQPTQRNDEDQLTQAIIALASQYGRYGVRRITPLLRQSGWNVGKDRVQRIWRREGLKVPVKQKPRGRLWLNDGSCIRLRPDCVRRPGSDDELAPLGLDSVLAGLPNLIRRRRKILKDWPNHRAGRELYSLCRTGTKHRAGHTTKP